MQIAAAKQHLRDVYHSWFRQGGLGLSHEVKVWPRRLAAQKRRTTVTKSMLIRILAGTVGVAALVASAGAEPSEGKNYGKCSPGYEWSMTLQNCVR
jgi:hypothetical protein